MLNMELYPPGRHVFAGRGVFCLPLYNSNFLLRERTALGHHDDAFLFRTERFDPLEEIQKKGAT